VLVLSEKERKEIIMIKALYIDPSGTIRYIENYPEEPKHKITYSNDFAWRHKFGPIIEREWDEYEQALQAAKDSAVPLDSNYLNAKELFDCFRAIGIPAVQAHQWLSERKDQVIPLPEGWTVEVKEDFIKHYSDADIEQGRVPCGEVFSSIRKVAILTRENKF
jgi:hypothetical protein